MNIIEEAQLYAELIKRGATKDQIARENNVNRQMVDHRLAWLQLPPEVQQLAAERKLPSNIRVPKALARLPQDYQVSEARRLASSRAKIAAIENSVDMLLNQQVIQESACYGQLSDGKPFLAVTLAEKSVNGAQARKLNEEAVAAARRVCELCSLQPNLTVCRPCPLVIMLSVLIRKE